MDSKQIIPSESAMQVFTTPGGLDPYLQEIRRELDAFVPDMSTEAGRKAIASIAYKVSRMRTQIDDVGKGLVETLKETPKKIDAERKRMRELLDAWRDEVRAPLNEYEARQKAERDACEARYNSLNALVGTELSRLGKSAEQLEDDLAALMDVQLSVAAFGEFLPLAEQAKAVGIQVLPLAIKVARSSIQSGYDVPSPREQAIEDFSVNGIGEATAAAVYDLIVADKIRHLGAK